MILTCPSCGTQYVVKDGAIPEGGRQVRCASCKHSWHQEPEPEAPQGVNEDAVSAQPVPAPAGDGESSARPDAENPGFEVDDASGGAGPQAAAFPSTNPAPEVTAIDPVAAEEVFAPAYSGEAEEPAAETGQWTEEDDFAPFGQRGEEEEPARGTSPLLKLLLVVLLVAAVAAAFWFLAPAEWKARMGVAQAGQSELKLMLTNSQRQQLASGNMLLAVTGRVVNPTDETQRVPPIEAELRSKTGQIVYRWTIAPPATNLPPGGRAPFNSAEVNVPADGDLLTLAFGSAAA